MDEPTFPPQPTEEQMDGTVLALLLDRFPGPVPEQELERAHGDRIVVRDAVARLIQHGLAHRYGDLLLASAAAARFHSIQEAF